MGAGIAPAPWTQSRRSRLNAWFGAWLAVLAVDLFFNAGLLADRFTDGDPVLLGNLEAARRIPVAYGAWAIQVAGLQWLLSRLGVTGRGAAARYGAVGGFLAGAVPLIAIWTIVRLDTDLVGTWSAAAVIEGAIAGLVIAYLGREGGRGWRIVAPGVLATVIAAFVLQNVL